MKFLDNQHPDAISGRSQRLVRSLCHGVLFLLGTMAALRVSAGPHLSEDMRNSANIRGLVEDLERNWVGSIQRGSNGEVVTIAIPPQFATDENMRLLSSSSSLETLIIGGSSNNLGGLTKAGISALAKAPRLRTLSLQCFGELPDDVLEGVSKVCQLRELRLSAAFPKASANYCVLTNLTKLEKLHIGHASNFGSNELGTLSGLLELRDLSLMETGVKGSDLGIFAQFRSLTNGVLIGDRSRIRFQRNRNAVDGDN